MRCVGISSLAVVVGVGCGGAVLDGGTNDAGTTDAFHLPFEPPTGDGAPGSDGGSDGGSASPCTWTTPSASKVWVAFDSTKSGGNRDIFVIRGDATGLRQLTNDIAEDREPAFSPDGTKLAFTTDRDSIPQIWIMDLTTGLATELTHQPKGAEQAAWSFDGKVVAYHAIATPALYTINADGTSDTHVIDGIDSFNSYKNPTFTINGDIAVDRNNEIDLIENGTVKSQPVHNWTTTIEQPSASPDGPLLAVAISCDAESIWIVGLNSIALPCQDGTRLTPLCLGSARSPSWGANDYLAYEHGGGAEASTASDIILVKRGADGAANLTKDARGGTNRNPSVALSPTIQLPP